MTIDEYTNTDICNKCRFFHDYQCSGCTSDRIHCYYYLTEMLPNLCVKEVLTTDLIDRDAAIACLDSNAFDSYENAVMTLHKIEDIPTVKCVYAKGIVDRQPTIDPEVRHGRWIPYTKNRDENVTNVFQCSECEKTVRFIMAHNMCEYTFCPLCGARMDGGVNQCPPEQAKSGR